MVSYCKEQLNTNISCHNIHPKTNISANFHFQMTLYYQSFYYDFFVQFKFTAVYQFISDYISCTSKYMYILCSSIFEFLRTLYKSIFWNLKY